VLTNSRQFVVNGNEVVFSQQLRTVENDLNLGLNSARRTIRYDTIRKINVRSKADGIASLI